MTRTKSKHAWLWAMLSVAGASGAAPIPTPAGARGAAGPAVPAGAPPIPFVLGFAEAFSEEDSRTTQGFRRSLENALFHFAGRHEARLSKCGYALSVRLEPYRAGDAEGAMRAADALSAAGAWFAVGPSNSKHYLLFAKRARSFGTVSLMANASTVHDLKLPRFALSPSPSVLARRAWEELGRALPRAKGAAPLRVGAAVGEDCVSCREFEKAFQAEAGAAAVFPWSVRFVGLEPDPKPLVEKLRSEPVDVLLLPNSSRPTGALLAALAPLARKPFVVGQDGWGNDENPLLAAYPVPADVRGLCVRGEVARPGAGPGASGVLGYRAFVEGKPVAETYSVRALDLIFETLVETLCREGPKDSPAFSRALRAGRRDLFSAHAGTAVFSLQGNTLRREGPMPITKASP